MKLYRDEKDYWYQVMIEFAVIAQKHTIPFFINNDEGVNFIGSSIFLNIQNRYFIVSACHVMNTSNYKNLVVPYQKSLLEINGDLKTTSIPKELNKKLDRIDISILEINRHLADKLLEEYIALPSQRLGINHEKKHNEERYLILGPPGDL